MYVRGSVYYPQPVLFSRLVFPFAQIKKLLEKIYDSILQSIWQELIFGKTIENEVTNLLLFVIFCLFSLAIFHLQAYRTIILVAFFLLWFIDRAIAQNYYNNPKHKFLVSLKITDETLYLRQYLPKGQTLDLEFERNRAKEIAIFSRTLYSDGFQAELQQCWQVILFLQDDTDLLIDEQTTPAKALSKAKQIAQLLPIPIIFLDSEGNPPYANHPLSETKKQDSNTIQRRWEKNKYHLYSKWRFRDSWQLLKQIFVQSGFLIFIMISTNFMVRLGGIIDAFLTAFFTEQATIINWPSISQWFNPNFDLGSYLEIAFVVGIILFQGARISRTQHIYMDRSGLRYYVGRQKQGELSKAEMEAVLLIPEPDLMVLILAKGEALTIHQLPTPGAHREMVAQLEEMLES